MTAIANPRGSVARAAIILDVLAASAGETSLSEVARVTQFSKTTTHRVLSSLLEARFVVREPDSRGYRLGSALAVLGGVASQQEISVLSGPALERLASLSDDTVFLSIPEGNAAVCLERKVGSFPIKTLTLDRGDRRPMGVGAGSLALYCVMPEAARRTLCRQNAAWMADFGDFTWETLEKARKQYQRDGYALNRQGIIRGMSAVAVPVLNKSGRAAAAITIAAINERMTLERIKDVLAPAIKHEAQQITLNMSDQPVEGTTS